MLRIISDEHFSTFFFLCLLCANTVQNDLYSFFLAPSCDDISGKWKAGKSVFDFVQTDCVAKDSTQPWSLTITGSKALR